MGGRAAVGRDQRWPAALCTCFGFLLFIHACLAFKVCGSAFLWHRLWHDQFVLPVDCKHPQLPTNQSGVKVVVATLMKMGTRTIAHALNDIGIRALHGEDMALWPLREWAVRMQQRHPEKWYWQPTMWTAYLNAQSEPRAHEELAAALSRCRVEGVALDCMENLIWPIYYVSPGTKVLWLNWRTWDQWVKSITEFSGKVWLSTIVNILLSSSTYAIPWGTIVRLLDPLLGSPVAKALADGGPPFNEVEGPLMWFYQQTMASHNYMSAIFPIGQNSIFFLPANETEYENGLDLVPKRVPPEDYMQVDPRTTTYEEICRFLEVVPCPMKGKLPKAVNTWTYERDFPVASFAVNVVRLFMHWVNWRLFLGACSCCRGRCRGGREKTA
mmetsp:Transcript_57077/g.172670  ORF Transcript_57077/g.172670 Transcript_57077/m.172670 type:complete len:384 (+) Transcript_57077:75-1226(+)